MSGESGMCVAKGHIVSSFKYLDNCFVLINLNDTADLLCSVIHMEFDNLLKRGILYTFQNYQRAVYFT